MASHRQAQSAPNVSLVSTAILQLLAGYILLFTVPAQAEEHETLESEDWYQVEYILLEHLEGDRHELRYEDIDYQDPMQRQYAYFYPGNTPITQHQYTALKGDELDLKDSYQRLKRDRRIKVLEYRAWQQAINSDEHYPALKIASPIDSKRSLLGGVELSRKRYIHAELDVYLLGFVTVPNVDLVNWLFEASEFDLIDLLLPQGSSSPLNLVANNESSLQLPVNIVHLKESRRIKDGEVHYIDHPALAALITVKAIDAPFSYGESTQ